MSRVELWGMKKKYSSQEWDMGAGHSRQRFGVNIGVEETSYGLKSSDRNVQQFLVQSERK